MALRIVVCFLLAFASQVPARLKAQANEKPQLVVFAAASLTEVFRELGKNFEAQNSVTVQFDFAGSQQLVQQLALGARADVLATADIKQMSAARRSGLIDSSSVRILARNRLVVIAPEDNPAHIARLQDLAVPNLKIVIADSAVPAGRYARQVLERCSDKNVFGTLYKDRVLKNIVSFEENVRAVLAKVQLGECDAGIVYHSDVASDSLHRITRIEIPDSLNVVAEYPIAIARESNSREAAAKFFTYVLSEDAAKVLSKFGFIPTTPSGRSKGGS